MSAAANFRSWEAGLATLSPEQAASLYTQEPRQVTRLRKERGAELQILSHLGLAKKTTLGHLPLPEGCRLFPQMPVSLDFLRRTPGEGA